jgi:hypothetical protein
MSHLHVCLHASLYPALQRPGAGTIPVAGSSMGDSNQRHYMMYSCCCCSAAELLQVTVFVWDAWLHNLCRVQAVC